MPKGAPRTTRATIDRHAFVPHYLGVLSNTLIWSQSRFFLEAYNCGINEIRIISSLGFTPGLTATNICSDLRMNKSIVSKTLSYLVNKGWLFCNGSGRNRSYELTEEGWAMNEKIIPISLERERRLLRGFSDLDKAVLLGYLARMTQNLDHAADFAQIVEHSGLDQQRPGDKDKV